MSPRLIIMTAIIMLGYSQSASAANCYVEQVTIPAGTLVCDKDHSDSADFTNSCHRTTKDAVKKVPVTCGKMWVPAPASWSAPARGDICEHYNMDNADLNGVICASASMQPRSGNNYGAINHYQYDAPPMGSMGGYPREFVGGKYIYQGSLNSGAFCSKYPGPRGGYITKWVTARVCEQKGKVN